MEARYSYDADNHQWIGLVIEGNCVLTLGCEYTEEAIIKWLEAAVKMKPWIEGNDCPKDMYDRRV